MITIREIADDKSTISSTRWGFATIIKFDVMAIIATIIAYVIGHFTNHPFGKDIFEGVALLLGVLTGFLTAAKAMQGFEPRRDKANNSDS